MSTPHINNVNNNNSALVLREGAPTAAVEEIMRSIVSNRSSSGYDNQNTAFIMWLYDDHNLCEVVLRDWMVERLHVAKREDDINSSTKKQRINQRMTCKQALHSIKKGDKTTYPIVLEKVSFNIFSHYLTTTKKGKNGLYLSSSSFEHARSALVYLF